jgi:hypothetical protein
VVRCLVECFLADPCPVELYLAAHCRAVRCPAAHFLEALFPGERFPEERFPEEPFQEGLCPVEHCPVARYSPTTSTGSYLISWIRVG